MIVSDILVDLSGRRRTVIVSTTKVVDVSRSVEVSKTVDV